MKKQLLYSLRGAMGSSLCLLAAGMLLHGSACGAEVAQDQLIYNGSSIAQAGITVGSWGSGLCEESSKAGYSGSRSLKFTSKSLFQGGRIDFAKPVNLTAAFNNASAYLQVITNLSLTASGYEDELTADFAPATYDVYGTGWQSRTGKPANRMRLFLVLEGGAMVECQVDLSGFKLSDDGWLPVSFPFAVLKGKLDLQEYKVKRLVIGGNGTDPFYVGEIRVITDTRPIEVYAGEDQFVAAYDDVMFRGECNGGAAAAKYAWDFDSRDGLQEDAVGEVVYHRYRKPGDYTVTLQVSDVFGLKRTAVSNLKVTVYD